MFHRRLGLPFLVAAAAAVGLPPAPAAAQGQAADAGGPAWTMPRTSNGRPDLQGFWTTQTFTPLERPAHLGDQAFYSEEEWASIPRSSSSKRIAKTWSTPPTSSGCFC